MSTQLQAARASVMAQWQANRRLRLAVGVALLVAVLNLALQWNDARSAQVASFQTDRSLLARLEGAAADDAWLTRATEAEEALAALEKTLTTVAGPGEAQAELQALLTNAATSAGVQQVRVRTDGVAEIESVPEVWEVSARVVGDTTPASVEAFLRDLAARPWVRVERIEARDGSPGQSQIIVRGFFLRAPSAENAP